MQRHFYFFRHAQTNENDEGKRYGTGINAWLTELGIKQAKKLGKYLADKNIEIVYSSPYKRAIDTAKIAIQSNSAIKIIPDDALVETVFGFWYEDNEVIAGNFNKIKSCLENIVENDVHQNIAIASHGGVTRALCWACGHKVEGIKNGECFHFVLENKKWKFVESFNCDD